MDISNVDPLPEFQESVNQAMEDVGNEVGRPLVMRVDIRVTPGRLNRPSWGECSNIRCSNTAVATVKYGENETYTHDFCALHTKYELDNHSDAELKEVADFIDDVLLPLKPDGEDE